MCPNPQFPADLVTFTEEIRNGKLHFLCSARGAASEGPAVLYTRSCSLHCTKNEVFH